MDIQTTQDGQHDQHEQDDQRKQYGQDFGHRRDIQDKEDIALLVDQFYKKVIQDPVIGHFFTRVVSFSWEEHIPIMISFWDTLLFGVPSYKGNPMVKHIALNQLETMERRHFDQWLGLWEETIKEHFAGPKSEEAIKRAWSIAAIMELKIQQSAVK